MIDQHSSLSLKEYVQIIATWHHDTNRKQYNCADQIKQMKNGPNAEKKIEGHKNRNGCNRIQKEPRQTHDIVQFHNCYCDHLHPSFDHLLFLHDHYSHGNFPQTGSISDQSNKLIEIFRVIDRLKMDREIELQKERTHKAKKKNGKR